MHVCFTVRPRPFADATDNQPNKRPFHKILLISCSFPKNIVLRLSVASFWDLLPETFGTLHDIVYIRTHLLYEGFTVYGSRYHHQARHNAGTAALRRIRPALKHTSSSARRLRSCRLALCRRALGHPRCSISSCSASALPLCT